MRKREGREREREQGRNSWGARGACAPPKKKFRLQFSEGAWRDHIASQRRLLIAGLEDPKITFASCFNWNVEGKTRKKRKNASSFVCVLGCWRIRTAAIDRTTFHARQRSGTKCSTSDYLRKKAAKAQWKAITRGQRWKVPSVQVGCGLFESCSCWLARECFWGKARENVEELKSQVDYTVCCWEQNIALRGHRNNKGGSSNSFWPQ